MKKSRKILLAILIVLLVLTAAAIAVLILWRSGAFLPRWIRWKEAAVSCDLNRDGQEDRLIVRDRQAAVAQKGSILFQSANDWKVSDALAADVDADGGEELILLVWKRGSYGSEKPFWVDRDEWDFSQHIFIYGAPEGTLRPLWMSSALEFAAVDWSADENGRLHILSTDGSETIWGWDYFGLKLMNADGTFRTEVQIGTEGEQELYRSDALPSVRASSDPGSADAQAAGGAGEDGSGAGGSGTDGSGADAASGGSDASAGSDQSSAAGNGSAASSGSDETASSSSSEEEPEEEGPEIHTVSLIAVGDNLIHRAIYDNAYVKEERTYDFHPVYEPVKDVISAYDIAVINQETIFVSDYSLRSTYPRFGTPDTMGEALVDTGFDVILSATNHTNDKGQTGIQNTLDYWKQFPQITLLGLHETEEDYNTIDIVEKNGVKIAMFNYTYGLNGLYLPAAKAYQVDLLAYEEKLIEDLKKAEKEADISICFIHKGVEYYTGVGKDQRDLAKRLIDAGADVLINAHPHVIEPFEELTTDNGNTGIVYYSCGNFISTMLRSDALLGGAAVLRIEKTVDGETAATVVTDFSFVPVINHYGYGENKVYFLADYTEDLAHVNKVWRNKLHFTDEWCWKFWEKVTGLSKEETPSPGAFAESEGSLVG